MSDDERNMKERSKYLIRVAATDVRQLRDLRSQASALVLHTSLLSFQFLDEALQFGALLVLSINRALELLVLVANLRHSGLELAIHRLELHIKGVGEFLKLSTLLAVRQCQCLALLTAHAELSHGLLQSTLLALGVGEDCLALRLQRVDTRSRHKAFSHQLLDLGANLFELLLTLQQRRLHLLAIVGQSSAGLLKLDDFALVHFTLCFVVDGRRGEERRGE